MRRKELTDEQWAAVEPLMTTSARRNDPRGRPPRDACEVLGGVLWVLRNDARWHDLPDRFPPPQTCHRRFRQWVGDGTLRLVLEAVEEDLRERGRLDVAECSLDHAVAGGAGHGREGSGGARGGESWQQRTAMLFLSPATRRLLRCMKSRLGRRF